MKKVITIGEILVEIMATEVGDGFLEPIPLVGPFPSGAPAIFIDQVAKLGQPCGMIGCVGDDDFGRLNVERLRRDGADVSAIAVDPDAPDRQRLRPLSRRRRPRLRLQHPPQRQRGDRPDRGGRRADRPAPTTCMSWARRCRRPRSRRWSATRSRRIRARGGTVSFDPNLRKETPRRPRRARRARGVLAQTDLFLPSGEELFLVSDADRRGGRRRASSSPAASARSSSSAAPTARQLRRSRDMRRAPAFAVEEVDPTGAGDCFGATYRHLLAAAACSRARR